MTDTLAVTLLTAHRLEYALQTTEALARNLVHDGPVHFHCASDGDDDNYVGAICDAWRKVRGPRGGVTASNSAGVGYGANMNLAMQTTHPAAAYQMPVEDDWILQRPLDTAPILKMLACGGWQSREEWQWAVTPPEGFWARSVRLGYLGLQWPLRMSVFKTDEHLWAALDETSPDQNVQAGHPRIETTAYERAVGPWPEGFDPGKTELGWVQTEEARRGVVWPLSIVALTGSVSGNLFAHCGAVRSY